jgi:hypothetical protein
VKSTGQIGAKVAEIQATTREVVSALTGVAEAIDHLSDVTGSVAAAIEHQRNATENFAASARETSAATSDVVGRIAGIATMVQRSRATAQDVSTIAGAMQTTSQILRHEIPEIVRKAVHADLREFPRYDVTITAQLEWMERSSTVTVYDVSEGGARLGPVDGLALGHQVQLTFPGMKPINADVVRESDEGFGLCFAPARLRIEELRDLVALGEQAA